MGAAAAAAAAKPSIRPSRVAAAATAARPSAVPSRVHATFKLAAKKIKARAKRIKLAELAAEVVRARQEHDYLGFRLRHLAEDIEDIQKTLSRVCARVDIVP